VIACVSTLSWIQPPRSPQASPESLRWGDETIAWQPDEPPGAQYAVLDGSRDTPGRIFTYAFRLPGQVWVGPHLHSQDAHVAVMKGSLQLGFGRTLDRSKTIAIPAGHFFIVRANEPPFEGSDDEVLIVGTALGGWTTRIK